VPAITRVVHQVLTQGYVDAPLDIDLYIESMDELAQEDNCIRFLFSVGFLRNGK